MSEIQLLNDCLITAITGSPGMTDADYRKLIQAEAACNDALTKWLNGQLDIDTFTDILEHYGHDMDGYFETVEENLDAVGL